MTVYRKGCILIFMINGFHNRLGAEEMGNKKRVIFMMGGPAAGKSTVRKLRYAGFKVLDSDEIKMSHPDYDPKNPGVFHAWSADLLVKKFYVFLSQNESFVYDGTGSTAEKYVAYIKAAQSAGFETVICYVKTSLAIALERNSKRDRVVPEYIVREKHSLIGISFEIVSSYADRIEVVQS